MPTFTRTSYGKTRKGGETVKIEIKKPNFNSIITRWFRSVFAVTSIVLLIIGIILAVLISSVFYDNVQKSASDTAREFSSLASSTPQNYRSNAISLCESFSGKDKVEVNVLDGEGMAFVSTSGFQPEKAAAKDDFKKALDSTDGLYVRRYKNSGGEYVMTGTTIVKDKSEKTLGAFSWAVSLNATRTQINMIYVIIFVVLMLIFMLYAVAGIRFLRSIVAPIREVGSTSRKIAMGDFEARIEKKRNDEIGDLCDSVNYMASELQNADRLKNDFISSVSHELRTPLTAIRGWGETAKMSIGTDEEVVSRGIDVVLSEADRLSGLVEELLDFSRMQQGRLKVNTAPIDVSELLCGVTDMYSELARKQGIEISYTPPVQNSIVMGDKDRLKQVFINIIDNAVKYTSKGGLVLVTQEREEGCIQIQIKDTGIGIAAKDIDHVKEKFYKANQTVRGSGIGLAVADEIIKQHNGLLFVESTEGVGTTVTVAVPLYEPPEETAEETAEEVAKETAAEETSPESTEAAPPENPETAEDEKTEENGKASEEQVG